MILNYSIAPEPVTKRYVKRIIHQAITLKSLIIKTALILVLILASSALLAEPSTNQKDILKSIDDLNSINAKLLLKGQEADLDTLLEDKIEILDTLLDQLKIANSNELSPLVDPNEVVFLRSRIKVNTEKGNVLATQRDIARLERYKTNTQIRKYLEYLIRASSKYISIEDIVEHSQALLESSINAKKQLSIPENAAEGQILNDFKKNRQDFLKSINSFQDILIFVINNPRNIASVHWFQEFSLLSAISYVNHFDIVQPLNNRLIPFQYDTGGIVLSFLIFFMVYFTYPFVFKATSWWIEKYVIDKDSEQQELIYLRLRSPVRAMLVFSALNLGTFALFYKTDYRSSLEGFGFIIYSILFIWLFFRIIDSVVLVQVEKISSSNKELRKELFNLGVQTAKAFLVIIVLAFGLNNFGISLTAIMSTLGVGGLAFALAAKDTLSNLFGGITILLDNVFKMGDWIKVDDVEGTVAEIGLRSTTIRTFDNALITVPNSLVSVSSVKNWNRRAVGRRIKLHVGITYESDMANVRQAIEDIREMLRTHKDIANPKNQGMMSKKKRFKFTSIEDTHGIKSTQLVYLDRYGDFSIDILIYCFARTVIWSEFLAVKENVLFQIADILEKNNLEFAYPTQVIIPKPEEGMGLSPELLSN